MNVRERVLASGLVISASETPLFFKELEIEARTVETTVLLADGKEGKNEILCSAGSGNVQGS